MKKSNTVELKDMASAKLLELTFKEVNIALEEFVSEMRKHRDANRCPKCGFWPLDKDGLKCEFCKVLPTNKEKYETNNPRDARIPHRR